MTFARFCCANILLLVMLAAPSVAPAAPTVQQQFEQMTRELRCLTCANETIAESASPMAQDVRLYIAQHLEMGDTPDQIKQALVARYGEALLYQPVVGSHTLLLWLAPVICIILGSVCVFFVLRRHKRKS